VPNNLPQEIYTLHPRAPKLFCHGTSYCRELMLSLSLKGALVGSNQNLPGPNLKLIENQALLLHTQPPPTTLTTQGCQSSFLYWGSQSIRSGGAMFGPEEGCVKFGGKPAALGAHAPTRRASPKKPGRLRNPGCICVIDTLAKNTT
jgi:hypothetical protein